MVGTRELYQFNGEWLIIASTPLRISLLGGSTDLEDFIEFNGDGKVISFPINLYTYISINERYDGKFLVQYSKKEYVKSVTDIKNDVVRVVLEHFHIDTPLTITLTADIPSDGSGMAASSSFTLSMIKAISTFKKINLSDMEICLLGLELERKFNPLTGRQDTVGCGIKGFKYLNFLNGEPTPIIKFYSNEYFNNHYFYLVSVGQGRSSTSVLESLGLEKRLNLYNTVKDGDENIRKNKFESLNTLILNSWEDKKETSPLVMNDDISRIENIIKNTNGVLSYRLCGAGNGGYMLVVSKNKIKFDEFNIKIDIDNRGMKSWTL